MSAVPSAVTDDWQITRLSGSLGAEIRGLRLAEATADDLDRVRTLLSEHLVLFFPDQFLDPDRHVAIGRHFGMLEGHPHLTDAANPPPRPEIFQLIASEGGIADEWHTDITFQERPAKMSILNMVRCPEVGGDTMWTNLCAAYDALSEPMKAFCEGLTALHDALPHNRPDQMAIHPVVRVHPVTRRKALYVSEHFTRRIVELNASESDALLRHLVNWVHEPRFTVRYRWTRGAIAMWDNTTTQHYVIHDFSGERIIQRVTVVGDEVEAAGELRWQPFVRPGPLSATSRFDRQLFGFLRQRDAAAD